MSKKVRLFATQRVTRKAKNGKDALQIIVEPDTLVFDTDENGLVNNSELSDKYAEIRCYRGNTDVTDLCRFFFEDGDNINCNANVLVNRVSFTKINTQTIEGNEVSFSNGYVNITINDESLNSHSVQIKFSINITKFIGGQISNNKKFESKYSKLTAGMSEGSSIIQTAQNISLEVTKSSLKKAGIEITTDQVKLYGDKVQVLTRKDGDTEYKEAAMFANGKLNANLIDADTITMNHLYAKSTEGGTIVGHFGNFDKADAIVGNEKCPLWLGAVQAQDAPFRVTSLGDLYSNSGKIGPFWISPPAFRDCLVSGTFDADPDATKYTSCIKLSKDLIDVVGKDDSTSGDIAGATSIRRVRIGTETKIDDYINPLYVKAWIDGQASMGTTATAGIIVDSKGSLEVGRAFWARIGSYAGFRRAIYETSYGFNAAYVCCEGYGLVVMNNTQNVTITCPKDYDGLEEGSELVIIRNNANLYFSGPVIQTGNGHTNITATSKYEIIHLYYLGSKGWYLNFESNY